MSKLRNIMILLLCALIIFFIKVPEAKASSEGLYLNNLSFNAQVNSDGSMDVTEIWDIDIEETNTLFKIFETDNTKFSRNRKCTAYRYNKWSKYKIYKNK